MHCSALALSSIAFVANAADVTIPVDGPPILVSAEKPGQPVRLIFRAEAGQRLGLGVSALKFVPASATGVGFTVKQPDGKVLRGMEMLHCVAANPGGACDGEFTVAMSGTHMIDVDIPFSAAPRFSIHVSTAVMRPLAAGKSEAVTLTRAGQDARFPLSIVAGQDVTVELGNIASSNADGRVALRVYRPDGSLLGQGSADSRRGATISLGSAAPAGTYVVEVDPDHGATGSFLVAAKAAAKAAEGAVEISSGVGEALRFGFAATAGQSVTLGLESINHTPDVDSNSVIAILKPDGTRLAGLGCRSPTRGGRSPCMVSSGELAAGNYTIVVTPPPGASVTGKLYRTTDAVAKLDPASPHRVELQAGQVGRYTFSASAGDRVGVNLARNSPDDKTMMYLSLLKPGGFSTGQMLLPTQGTTRIEPEVLPATGTYTITVDAKFNKASATLSLIR